MKFRRACHFPNFRMLKFDHVFHRCLAGFMLFLSARECKGVEIVSWGLTAFVVAFIQFDQVSRLGTLFHSNGFLVLLFSCRLCQVITL